MKAVAIFVSVILLYVLTLQAGDTESRFLYMPENFRKAYENNTRSTDGKTGPAYWQNRADYRIDVHFDPENRVLEGNEKILYFNNSPDTLRSLVFHLFPNLYKKGHTRDFTIDPADAHNGVTIKNISINGNAVPIELSRGRLNIDFTLMELTLKDPLLPDDVLRIGISWSYVVNAGSHMRTGGVDSTTYFIAYFFPRLAVYDDIDGWNRTQYTGRPEFYNDYGNFDVSVTIPGHYLVWATGTLQNAGEVLQKKYLERYQQARESDEIIHIIDSTEAVSRDIVREPSRNTWIFKADDVNDFAFALSDHYLWDGTSMVADPESERRVFIDAAYDKSAWDFYSVTDIARKSIAYMRDGLPGYPFPYSEITVFNGADGMEYPMMVNDISEENMNEAIKLTAHEILHAYFPFFVGCNETKYAWMDEGFTSFGDYMIFSELADPAEARFYYLDGYRDMAGEDTETPLFTISTYLKKPVYWHNSYPKGAAFFMVLYDLLGADGFKQSLHAFFDRWQGKHPTPYDWFNTVMDVHETDLEWLISPWFFRFGWVDLGITPEVGDDLAGESSISEETQDLASLQHHPHHSVTVTNHGGLPAPVHLRIVYDDTGDTVIKKTAEVWKTGQRNIEIDIPQPDRVITVELLNPLLIDADRSNDRVEF